MPTPRAGHTAVALALLVGPALSACAGGPGPESTPADHMSSHYSQVDRIQEAVVAGELDAVRGPARWISTHKGSEFPAAAGPSLETMRNEGRIMLAQTHTLEIARTLGRMGVACGDCHTALDAEVRFPVEEPPHTSQVPAEHMIRHAWAVDRLWEGLVGPSDASWRAGAGALVHMPVDFGDNDQANRLAERVHQLTTKATEATTPKARAEVYGDLLETCSLCHGALRLRRR